MINYYEVLGIAEQSSADRVSKVGRLMLEQTHPYVTGNKQTAQSFMQVYEAVAVLADKDLRAEYNYTLAGAIEKGDIAGAVLPDGAVKDRVQLAKKEAEMLVNDFVLFSDKFIEEPLPVNRENTTGSVNATHGSGAIIAILLLCGFSFLARGKDGPVIFYIIGGLMLIGAVLIYVKDDD